MMFEIVNFLKQIHLTKKRLDNLMSKFDAGGEDGNSPKKTNDRIESIERNIQHILRILEKR